MYEENETKININERIKHGRMNRIGKKLQTEEWFFCLNHRNLASIEEIIIELIIFHFIVMVFTRNSLCWFFRFFHFFSSEEKKKTDFSNNISSTSMLKRVFQFFVLDFFESGRVFFWFSSAEVADDFTSSSSWNIGFFTSISPDCGLKRRLIYRRKFFS